MWDNNTSEVHYISASFEEVKSSPSVTVAVCSYLCPGHLYYFGVGKEIQISEFPTNLPANMAIAHTGYRNSPCISTCTYTHATTSNIRTHICIACASSTLPYGVLNYASPHSKTKQEASASLLAVPSQLGRRSRISPVSRHVDIVVPFK